MEFVRLLSRGRLSECLADDATTRAVDHTLREAGLYAAAEARAASIDAETREYLEAHAAGINAWLSAAQRSVFTKPLEFLLVGHTADPWVPADSLVLTELLSYLGLAESQGVMEHVLLVGLRDALLRGDETGLRNVRRYQSLAQPYLDNLIVDIPRLFPSVAASGSAFANAVVPPTSAAYGHVLEHLPKLNLRGDAGRGQTLPVEAPLFMNSNNWAVGGRHTSSGKPIMASDPHLDIARLPPFWQELGVTVRHPTQSPDTPVHVFGSGIPGMAGYVYARTDHAAWSCTYGFMDLVDFFIEEVGPDGFYLAPRSSIDGLRVPEADQRPVTECAHLHAALERSGGAAPSSDVSDCSAWVWLRLFPRREVMRHRSGGETHTTYWYTHHGIIERDGPEDPNPPAPGLYLSRSFSIHYGLFRHPWFTLREDEVAPADRAYNLGTASVARAQRDVLLRAMTSAEDVADSLAHVTTSFNFVVVDKLGEYGNIVYQQTGDQPRRGDAFDGVSTGLLPRLGWDARHQWKGLVPAAQLARVVNPPTGVIATANNYHRTTHPNGEESINLHMGDYRSKRAFARLAEDINTNSLIPAIGGTTPGFSQALQCETFSSQAADFLNLLRPLFPTPQELASAPHGLAAATLLQDWDAHYDLDSEAAVVFEDLYWFLFERTFASSVPANTTLFPLSTWARLKNDTHLLIEYFQLFDRVLLGDSARHAEPLEQRIWFGGLSRREYLVQSLRTFFLQYQPAQTGARWRDVNQLVLMHSYFGGLFPIAFGFDAGPFPIPGSRASLNQGQRFFHAGRVESFGPSLRMIVDLGEDVWRIRSTIPGGVREERKGGEGEWSGATNCGSVLSECVSLLNQPPFLVLAARVSLLCFAAVRPSVLAVLHVVARRVLPVQADHARAQRRQVRRHAGRMKRRKGDRAIDRWADGDGGLGRVTGKRGGGGRTQAKKATV